MESSFDTAREALKPFLQTADGGLWTDAWPLPVEGPLADLDEALAKGMPGLAFVNVREAAEGVVRVAWTLLVHEVLAWAPSLESLQALPEDARAAARAVLDSALTGVFTLGGACFVAAETPGGGIATPLTALAAHLRGRDTASVAAAWHRTLADDRDLRGAIRALWAWRNHRFAHGFVGDADAYAALFDGRLTAHPGWERRVATDKGGSPFPALLSLLRGAGRWLAEAARATAALGWPSLAEAREWAPGGPSEPAPEPLAWRGGERPLYLWNRATPDVIRAVDVQSGDEQRFPLPPRLEAIARATRSALAAQPRPFAPYWGEDTSEQLYHDPRRVPTRVLRDRVLDALDAGHRRVSVTGAAGAGKTYLTLAVGEALEGEGVITLRVAAGASGAMDSDRLPHLLQEALERRSSRLRAVELDGKETRLYQVDPGDAEAVAGWWRQLVRANPGRRFVLILDGLDEWHAAGRVGVEILPPIEGEGSEALAVVFGYRSVDEVAPWLRPELAQIPSESVIDVRDWLSGIDGRELLRRYLETQHPTVPAERRDDVIDRADGRFLWVFHYARGLAAGFVDASAAAEEWPAPEVFYDRYLAWLEDRMGGAPGYVRCLRRTLLTFALARMPINDETLAWLWEVEDDVNGRPPEGWLDWFEPVLRDLRDFLVRGPVALDGPTEAEQRAALVTVFDAKRDSRFAVCRGLAHVTLGTYLLGDAVHPAWRAERAGVAQQLAARARTVLDGAASGGPEEDGAHARATAPIRFAQQAFWTLHDFAERADEALERYVHSFCWLLPREDASVTGYLGHWIFACTDGAAAFDRRSPATATPQRSTMRYEVGRLLRHASRAVEAVAELRLAVELSRALARLPLDRAPDADELAEALARDPGAVRELAIALGMLGQALRDSHEIPRAVEAHHQEHRLMCALARLPADEIPDTGELAGAIERSPRAVRDVAIALGRLGVALEFMQKAKEAVEVHQQELRLKRALARLPLDRAPDADELAEALARDPGAIRSLAIALNTLGVALRAMQKAKEAVEVHQQELRLKRALARLPLDRAPDADELAEALARDPGAVRELAIALNTLGVALCAMQKAKEAVEVHEQELRLKRALARLPLDRAPDADELAEALARDPGAVRELAIAEYTLGLLVWQLDDRDEALVRLASAVVMQRAVATLPKNAPLELVDQVVARRPQALFELGLVAQTHHEMAVASGAPLSTVLEAGMEALRCYGALSRLGVDGAEESTKRLLRSIVPIAAKVDSDEMAWLPDIIEISRRVGLA